MSVRKNTVRASGRRCKGSRKRDCKYEKPNAQSKFDKLATRKWKGADVMRKVGTGGQMGGEVI